MLVAFSVAPSGGSADDSVHDAVAAAGLRSESEGVEPERYVVVLPTRRDTIANSGSDTGAGAEVTDPVSTVAAGDTPDGVGTAKGEE